MRTTLAVVTAAAVVSTAHATTVWLDADANSISATTGEGAHARYRISNTNWDAVLSTSSSITPAVIVQQSGVANNNQLNTARFAYALNYSVADGHEFNPQPPYRANPSAAPDTIS